ncbi:ThiF family adenylyltransferase [Ralstonia solanacearum]|uniref:Molybdopterin biosynthesis protein n=2 Tax=Ralstonia solanacearum TaxID=305 RepID=F6G4Q2_RALS8|nr:ThiF family adenylyltransferase [Ralstonia solanacearum]AEG67311.1 molybdopterin biosynthesis protein [Ralstonia solanacearum Po82]MCG3573462.1 ThiF family adenylyltransferase [Ralstonia solanacearum]MCL9838906.1 ThiF family adenylyltransferase [Ralstonia solanacearum]MDB0531664.1 ThiF family adenylyltransferase [Ralstonia solanacearum]MDB0538813.1 ThiF family adenylyltransferase [Ralstonia solanacearum]
MSVELASIRDELSEVLLEPPIRGNDGSTAYRLALVNVPAWGPVSTADVVFPKGFPDHAVARIRLSSDAVLQVPHVEEGGFLCIDGEPGPGRGLTPLQRVQSLLISFQEQFLVPWANGELNEDFAKEPQNYWQIYVGRLATKDDAAREVWTVDPVPRRAQVREGLLLQGIGLIVAGADDNPFVKRLIKSLGRNASPQRRVLIADIPISHPFVPATWPRNVEALRRILKARLKAADFHRFHDQSIRRQRGREHRIALFRAHDGAFAFALPGGPPTVHPAARPYRGVRARSRQSLQPMLVERVDPDWTVGRDQFPQVPRRQAKRVVVFGAGALGSPVVEQLARAGVGHITLVDYDVMEPANIDRHLLGLQHMGHRKVTAVADVVNKSHPSCVVTPFPGTAQKWLQGNSLRDYDLAVDLTGEPTVQWYLNEARRQEACPLVVGWMEPFVAAAHVCLLTPSTLWFPNANRTDRLKLLEAIDWPGEVIRQVPGCSSRFQAYTSANAAYAVALVSENVLQVIDGEVESSKILSWVRGRQFLDKQWQGLTYREWAADAAEHVGITKERPFA